MSEHDPLLFSWGEFDAPSLQTSYRKHRKRALACAAALVLVCIVSGALGSGLSKRARKDGISNGSLKAHPKLAFLRLNASPQWLPLSYMVEPPDYFEKIPESLRPHMQTIPSSGPPECPPDDVKAATKEQWDVYTAQTEKMLVSKGCNVYDAAVGAIALAVGGHVETAAYFYRHILDLGQTSGQVNIRGTAPCHGREAFGECDSSNGGNCGLCYGDNNASMTPEYRHAWFYRMIGDNWAYQDVENALCPANQSKVPASPSEPVRPRFWTWVDWKPVLGDNAWVLLTGACQVLWQECKGNAAHIHEEAPELNLALDFVASLNAMKAGDSGGFYFCPRNTYFGAYHVDIGSLVSTENNASLLAGLKALRYLLKRMKRPNFDEAIREIEDMIAGIETFIRRTYDTEKGYFRTGGRWDPKTSAFVWDEVFAVDCQSWVGGVLGAPLVDKWFGPGASLRLWEKTKQVAGYSVQANGMVKGVGYTSNGVDQVMSGEWSLGAANFLKIMATDSAYPAAVKSRLMEQAEFIAQSVQAEITRKVHFSAEEAEGVLYANKRYLIPPELGGWWANALPSRASTAWAFLWEAQFNPLHLQGHFSGAYDL